MQLLFYYQIQGPDGGRYLADASVLLGLQGLGGPRLGAGRALHLLVVHLPVLHLEDAATVTAGVWCVHDHMKLYLDMYER